MKEIILTIKKTKKMKIEIKKSEKLTGEVYWNIYIDGSCEKSFLTFKEASEFYDLILKNKQLGLPRTSTIKSIEI